MLAFFSPASQAAIVAAAFAKSSVASSYDLPSTSCVVNGRCQPSLPRRPSFAQSVSFVPGPDSATARNHIAHKERMKTGNARIRCVTKRSILSENVVLPLRFAFFVSALSIRFLMNS